jgi:hypothetical protein
MTAVSLARLQTVSGPDLMLMAVTGKAVESQNKILFVKVGLYLQVSLQFLMLMGTSLQLQN